MSLLLLLLLLLQQQETSSETDYFILFLWRAMPSRRPWTMIIALGIYAPSTYGVGIPFVGC